MSYRGRDNDAGNMNKMDLGESRRYGANNMEDKMMDDPEERRF
ncbi:hypothetical protein NPIL_339141, partial [Nephila pilipes]